MTRVAAALLLALGLATGAHAAGSGTIKAAVRANPLSVSLSIAPGQVAAGAPATATATVRNLGTAALSTVAVTLRADPTLTVANATKSIASLAGLGSAQLTWPVCSGGAGSFLLVAAATAGAFTAESTAQLLQAGSGSAACPESTTATVAGGQTVTTDSEGDGATPADPIETSVTTPNAGTVSIAETTSTKSPTAFSFVGWQVQISAPAATADRPLRLVFRLDSSLGAVAAKLQVFRNGVQVPDCRGTGAAPDPCVSSRSTLADGDVELTVLTSAASTWVFGSPILSRGVVAGILQASNGASIAFAVGSDGTTVRGALAYNLFRATQFTALAVSDRKAWLAGIGADGRTFLAYMEDNGAAGRGDVFRLWIAGVEQTTDGKLAKGDLGVAG